MIREIDEKLIKPEKLFQSSDMAKVGCSDCKGCSTCCRDTAISISLDPYDVGLLKEKFNMTFNGLTENKLITFTIVDGVVLPALPKKNNSDECAYLGENGRCRIHDYRPGICRMFPLARIYHEDGSFSYFLQEGECPKNTGVKIKISKWLGYKDIKRYEESVRIFHDELKKLRAASAALKTHEERIALQTKFLEEHFI